MLKSKLLSSLLSGVSVLLLLSFSMPELSAGKENQNGNDSEGGTSLTITGRNFRNIMDRLPDFSKQRITNLTIDLSEKEFHQIDFKRLMEYVYDNLSSFILSRSISLGGSDILAGFLDPFQMQVLKIPNQRGIQIDFIGKLVNLKELDLRSMHLKKIPDSFSNLSRLSKLHLSDNPDLYPHHMPVMSSVEDLNFPESKIKNPAFIESKFPNVSKLTLDDNEGILVHKVKRTKSLTALSLMHCSLTNEDIQTLAENHPQLLKLNVCDNSSQNEENSNDEGSVTNLEPLSAMTLMENLNALHVPIQTVHFLSHMQHLKKLFLHIQKIQGDPKDYLPALSNLQVLGLYARYEPVNMNGVNLHVKYPQLEELGLTGMTNLVLEGEDLSQLRALRKIDVSYSKFIDVSGLRLLETLEELDMSSATVTKGTEVLKDIKTLKKLHHTIEEKSIDKDGPRTYHFTFSWPATLEGEKLREYLETISDSKNAKKSEMESTDSD